MNLNCKTINLFFSNLLFLHDLGSWNLSRNETFFPSKVIFQSNRVKDNWRINFSDHCQVTMEVKRIMVHNSPLKLFKLNKVKTFQGLKKTAAAYSDLNFQMSRSFFKRAIFCSTVFARHGTEPSLIKLSGGIWCLPPASYLSYDAISGTDTKTGKGPNWFLLIPFVDYFDTILNLLDWGFYLSL